MATQHSALLVVDVQKDFCEGGALAVPGGDRVVPVLNRYLQQAVAEGWRVYASRDWHPPRSHHFRDHGGEWPIHCVQHSEGAAFHADLRLPPSTAIVSKGQGVDDPGYSAVTGRLADGRTLLDDLREHDVQRLFVGGLATDYCVKHSVLDACDAGIDVTVLEDAIAAVDVHPGDGARALAEMRAAGAKIEVRSPDS